MNGYLRNILAWGLGLWLFGYLLGFVFYAFVPPAQIGWWVMPLGIAATCLALWRYVRVENFADAARIGLGWAVIAIVCDYLFLVKLLNPPDGYYKLDVYLYYALTLLLPFGAAALRRGATR